MGMTFPLEVADPPKMKTFLYANRKFSQMPNIKKKVSLMSMLVRDVIILWSLLSICLGNVMLSTSFLEKSWE